MRVGVCLFLLSSRAQISELPQAMRKQSMKKGGPPRTRIWTLRLQWLAPYPLGQRAARDALGNACLIRIGKHSLFGAMPSASLVLVPAADHETGSPRARGQRPHHQKLSMHSFKCKPRAARSTSSRCHKQYHHDSPVARVALAKRFKAVSQGSIPKGHGFESIGVILARCPRVQHETLPLLIRQNR